MLKSLHARSTFTQNDVQYCSRVRFIDVVKMCVCLGNFHPYKSASRGETVIPSRLYQQSTTTTQTHNTPAVAGEEGSGASVMGRILSGFPLDNVCGGQGKAWSRNNFSGDTVLLHVRTRTYPRFSENSHTFRRCRCACL